MSHSIGAVSVWCGLDILGLCSEQGWLDVPVLRLLLWAGGLSCLLCGTCVWDSACVWLYVRYTHTCVDQQFLNSVPVHVMVSMTHLHLGVYCTFACLLVMGLCHVAVCLCSSRLAKCGCVTAVSTQPQFCQYGGSGFCA